MITRVCRRFWDITVQVVDGFELKISISSEL